MRILNSVELERETMYTTTPSEPVLANAAMHHLNSTEEKWRLTLRTFTIDFLNHGIIEKGIKGELHSRLILTLAHDGIEHEEFRPPTFTVHRFLKALYAEPCHEELGQIDGNILGASMNFLSFTSTQEDLTSDSFQCLNYLLLRRCSALQLAPNQPVYDQLLPFYCGDPDEPFDLNQTAAILIQVKNRKEGSTPTSILGESFYKLGSEPRGDTHLSHSVLSYGMPT
jgi:hypothetical protein